MYHAELLEARPFVCGEGGEVGDAFEHREQGCASDDRRDDGVGPAGVPYPTRGGLACVRGAEAAVVAEAAEAAEAEAEGEAAETDGEAEAAAEAAEAAAAEAAEVEAAEALSVVRVAVGEGKHRMVHLR